MGRRGEILKADCLHNGVSKNTVEQAATLTEGLAARHGMGRGQKGQPFRRSPAFTEPVMLQETQGESFETFTQVQFIDHYC